MKILPCLCLNVALASVMALGISVAAAQDNSPSRMEKIKANLKHNREKVHACRQEAIDKNIPRRNRAAFEQDCFKKAK